MVFLEIIFWVFLCLEKPHPAEEPPEVYAVHVDPTHSGRVVTGGRDDAAYVWNITTGQVIFECTGNFTALEFFF